MLGTILRFENSSIHDGPGLRTVVFLKGCPLNCAWCSTPESQSPQPERGRRQGKCSRCGACLRVCPQGAWHFEQERLLWDKSKCQGCNACVAACPNGAIVLYGQTMTAAQAAERACHDSLLFFHSKGGVTLSGGEALQQAEFSGQLLRLCQQRGVHTALETSLYASRDQLEQVLPWLDLLYADLKHMDDAAHRRLVGQSNRLILDNLLYVRRCHPEIQVIARLPLIPGLNDSEENLLASCDFCQNQAQVSCLELLPFHKLGLETYRVLGRSCACADMPTPSSARMDQLRDFCRSRFPDLNIY